MILFAKLSLTTKTNLNHFVTNSFPIKNISYLQFYVVAGSKVQLGLSFRFNSSLLCSTEWPNT